MSSPNRILINTPAEEEETKRMENPAYKLQQLEIRNETDQNQLNLTTQTVSNINTNIQNLLNLLSAIPHTSNIVNDLNHGKDGINDLTKQILTRNAEILELQKTCHSVNNTKIEWEPKEDKYYYGDIPKNINMDNLKILLARGLKKFEQDVISHGEYVPTNWDLEGVLDRWIEHDEHADNKFGSRIPEDNDQIFDDIITIMRSL